MLNILLFLQLEKREAANQRAAKSLEQVFSVKLALFLLVY